MKNVAILEYMFIFDPSEAWSNGFQFERDIADFFAAMGFQAEVLDVSGGSNRRVINLSKIEQMPKLENKPEQVGPKQAIKQIKTNLNANTPTDRR